MPDDSRSEARGGDRRAARGASDCGLRPEPTSRRTRWRSAPGRARAALARTPAVTVRTWRLLGPEQRVAAAGAVLLAVSTLGPFGWIEVAELTVAAAVLYLLKKRADRAAFHLPFGDGIVIAAAGGWAALLILIRVPSRPLGQGLLALACAGLLVAAGLRERAKRPADDLPTREAPTERL
jgi:hypothetical protein